MAIDTLASDVKALAERLELTAEALVATLSLDGRGNRYKARVDLGLPALPAAANDPAQQARMKSHLDFALLSEPSRRWMRHLRGRAQEAQAAQSRALGEWAAGLHSRPDCRPAAWLRALAARLDEDIGLLRRMQQEQQASIKRIEADLQPLQARIAAEMAPGPASPAWGRLVDFVTSVATAVVQTVSRGVGLSLTGKVSQAEQLVNEREELAFSADATAAAIAIMLAARAWALAQLDMIARLRGRCADAARWLDESRAAAVRRLARQPYAHIDVTSVALAQQAAASLAAQIPGESLLHYAALDDVQLREGAVAPAAEQARALVSGLNWLRAAETAAALLPDALAPPVGASAAQAPNGPMRAAAVDDRSAGDGATGIGAAGDGSAAPDLALDAVQMLLDQAAAESLSLAAEAAPQDWLMVGLEDESNPPLSFGNASLVSIGRRDQLQVLRIQTGIRLGDVIPYRAVSSAFDQASQARNFYVMLELANDDPSRRAFGLGLAGGLIGAEGGQYLLRNVRLPDDDGGADNDGAAGGQDGAEGEARIPLGARIEDALALFAQHPAWADAVSASVDALPLEDLAARLQSWLARNRVSARGEGAAGDDLRRELAGYVRDRLALVAEQLKYTGQAARDRRDGREREAV
jgi:hypothetical protein